MGITLNKITYDLLELITANGITDDEALSQNQVKWWINTTRADLIRQQLNKGQSINPDIIQNIPCLDIIQVDSSLCPCDLNGCSLLRSELQLPQTIETYQQNMLLNVQSTEVGSRSFSIIPYAKVPWANSSKFGKNIIKAYVHNRYLYLISDIYFDKVSISGIFEFPEDLKNYASCDSTTPCYTDDSYYPIGAHMIGTLKKMIIDVNFSVLMKTRSLRDDINDAKPN